MSVIPDYNTEEQITSSLDLLSDEIKSIRLSLQENNAKLGAIETRIESIETSQKILSERVTFLDKRVAEYHEFSIQKFTKFQETLENLSDKLDRIEQALSKGD